MKLLLDTCTFLWIAADSPDLSEQAKRLFKDPQNEIYLSAVSVWEIVVKVSLGKLPLPEEPELFITRQRKAHEIQELKLSEQSVLQLLKLPPLHRDPFDRMLICESIQNELTILTPDPLIRKYPVRVIW